MIIKRLKDLKLKIVSLILSLLILVIFIFAEIIGPVAPFPFMVSLKISYSAY